MRLAKKIMLTLLGSCLIIPAYLLLFNKGLSLTNLSNSFFMAALLFFMIAAFIGIFISGFFDRFQKNMKDTLHLRKSTEPKDYLKTSDIFRKQPHYWLGVAIALLLISLVMLLL